MHAPVNQILHNRDQPLLHATLAGGGSPRFAQDGRYIITTSGTMLSLRDTDIEAVANQICAQAGAPLTAAEREQYLHGVAENLPCG